MKLKKHLYKSAGQNEDLAFLHFKDGAFHMFVTRSMFFLLFLTFLLTSETFSLQRESSHFIYYFEKQDSSVIDTIISRMEGNYDRILSDLELTFSSKINIHIYPTIQDFHNAIGWPNAPDWLVGTAFREVFVVSPLNPGSVHSYNTIINNVILHEFVHVCTAKLNTNLPNWVSEGFALFEAGPYYSVSSVVSAYNHNGRIPSLDELAGSYDLFNSLGGYPFSLTIFNFINDEYGMENIREFILNPHDFSFFDGTTKQEFQEKWFAYVNEKYLGITAAEELEIPWKYSLGQNFPNPFNPETTIAYNLPSESYIELKIFSASGKIVSCPVNEIQEAGTHVIKFNSLSSDGSVLSSGVYLYRLKAVPVSPRNTFREFTNTKKMILLK